MKFLVLWHFDLTRLGAYAADLLTCPLFPFTG